MSFLKIYEIKLDIWEESFFLICEEFYNYNLNECTEFFKWQIIIIMFREQKESYLKKRKKRLSINFY